MTGGDQGEYQRAAGGYLIWPLALFSLAREEPTASHWSRIHTRQAVTFGLVATVGYLIVLALPLIVVSVDAAITTEQTILLYGVGMLADVLLLIYLIAVALHFAHQASRGRLFGIPIVSAISDRVFRTPREVRRRP